MERAALAAYQADRTAALLGHVEQEPSGVADRVAAWEQWLIHDPTDTEETRAEARDRERLEAV